MNIDLDFKKCTSEDFDDLIIISKKTFVDAFEKDNDPEDFKNYIEKAFSRQTLVSEFKNSNSHFYFVYSKGNLVGYFKLNEGEAQNETLTESSLELERIYVISEYQSKGFGKHILNFIIHLVKYWNVHILWLGVWQKNKKAIAFYERYGFVKFGTHPYYIGNDKQTDWLMKLKLA